MKKLRLDNEIHIIGAGFSGLTMAYYLNLLGFTNINIYEKESSPGGLISTRKTKHGLIESAANTIINSELLENLLKNISLKAQFPRKESKKRYIYKDKVFRRWPLSFYDTTILISGLLKIYFAKSKYYPSKNQTIEKWATKVFNKNISQYLISTGLQGIYASSAAQLSASLIVGKIFNSKRKKIKNKGIISFSEGMGQLPKQLANYLINKGVKINYNHIYSDLKKSNIKVIATSLSQAKKLHIKINNKFSNVPLKDVSTITLFIDQSKCLVPGFGALYPRDQNIKSLGSLVNSNIFTGRSIDSCSETWIIENNNKNEQAVMCQVLKDRELITKKQIELKDHHVTTWKNAFPLYGLELEKSLEQKDDLESNHIYLTGNYLGQLGLSGILSYNFELANKIRSKYEKESSTAH